MASLRELSVLMDVRVIEGNKKAKEGQQAISSILSTLQKEKAYSDAVVAAAVVEFIQTLDGKNDTERLASFASASNRQATIRRLCFKSHLSELLLASGYPADGNLESCSRRLFLRFEIKEKDYVQKEAANYVKQFCVALCTVINEKKHEEEEVVHAIVSSDAFPPSVWSLAELNRFAAGSSPSPNDLAERIRVAAAKLSLSRTQPIDLTRVLDIFGSAPYKFMQTIPIIMRPQLERMHHPTVMDSLRKVLAFITDNIEWDYEHMPAMMENIQKHPGIPFAAEVAKCISFGDLYDIIVRVVTGLVLGEARGFDKCEMKLRHRQEEDSEKLLTVKEFRVLFGLPPEAYDKKGNVNTEGSVKARAHSFIAGVILIPFLQGLYEARGRYFDVELGVDGVFAAREKDVKAAIESTRSLDDKRSLRKLLRRIHTMHLSVISHINDCAANSKAQLRGEFEPLLLGMESLGLSGEAVFAVITQDVSKLRKSPKKRISEARKFLEMSKEAPDGAENVPPSVWADFFGANLKTISKVLKAAGTAINLDSISSLISSYLSDSLASNLPISASAKKTLMGMSDFKTVVQVSWENARGRLPMEINGRLVELLRDVHAFTRAKPKAKHPEVLCLKLLSITRPFVQEYFRCLYEVNGQDLYMTIVTLTSDDQRKMENLKAKAVEMQEIALERATGRRRQRDGELEL